MSTIEADEVVVTGGAGAPAAVSRVAILQFAACSAVPDCCSACSNCSSRVFRRSHRDTIPEQTNAVVRNSAPLPCTGDRKHGHVKQLFSTQTQIQSLSRKA